MAVTIRDVARASGYSVYTVSSTLNNKGRVAPATREKIQETIRRLGYNPSRNIPHAAPAAVKSIGLVIPGDLQSIHPSSYRAVMATKKSTARRGYDFTLYTEQDIYLKAVTGFHNGSSQISCSGLIVYTPQMDSYPEYLRNLAQWGIPMVLVRRPTGIRDIMIVRDSDLQAVTLLMDHLYGLGHRSIAYYGYQFRSAFNPERSDTYERYIRERGLSSDPALRIARNMLTAGADHRPESVTGYPPLQAYLRTLLSGPRPPTAALCHSDQLAVEMISTLRTMGIGVPAGFSVAGLNNDATAVMYNPPITSVNMPAEEMVEAACDLLVNPRPAAGGSRTILEFENRLIVRQSTGPVPAK